MSAPAKSGSSFLGWMQSTGQTSTHSPDFTPMHGSAMIRVIPGAPWRAQPPGRICRSLDLEGRLLGGGNRRARRLGDLAESFREALCDGAGLSVADHAVVDLDAGRDLGRRP